MSSVKILRASAGSGKTYRLAYQYIRELINAPNSYASILAVTFTNKATQEMKSRILLELNNLASGKSAYLGDLERELMLDLDTIKSRASRARTLILHDFSSFSISTIDKFFQRIVRSFFKELGLDYNYTIELENDQFLGEAVDRLIEESADNEELRTITERIIGSKLDNQKSWDFREELISIGKELLSESYIGSNIINSKEVVEAMHEEEQQVKILESLMQKKCAEAIELMKKSGLEPSDFKGASKSFVYYFEKCYTSKSIEKYSETFASAAYDTDKWYGKATAKKTEIKVILSDLMAITGQVINIYQELCPRKTTLELVYENLNNVLLLGELSRRLNELWTEYNRLPIHQTTRLINDLIESTKIPFIYEKVGNRYSIYMIDEFQDTSTGQWRNFIPLLDEALAKNDLNPIMLIGDVKQAIYRWRGGDWGILDNQVQRHFGAAVDDQEKLIVNWRSLPELIKFNNDLIGKIIELDSAELGISILKQVYDQFEQKPAPNISNSGGYVRLGTDINVREIIEDIIKRGYSERDIALLVRTKVEGKTLAADLLDWGYNIISDEAMLIRNSKAVDTIINCFRLAVNPHNTLSLSILNNNVGREYNAPFEDQVLLKKIMLLTPVEALELVIESLEIGSHENEISHLQALYQVIYDYSNNTVADIPRFLEWWDETGHKKTIYLPSEQDAVSIMTIHKSKGLQFPCVIIPYADWSLLPMAGSTVWSTTDQAPFAALNPFPVNYKIKMGDSLYVQDYARETVYSHIDNINLLYVAITRAERELYLIHKNRPAKNTISKLIAAVFDPLELGEKTAPKSHQKEDTSESIEFKTFNSWPHGQRIRSSWRSERYFENGQQIQAPRSYGVMMHSVFAKMSSPSDLPQILRKMENAGEISKENSLRILEITTKAMTNPLITGWFDPGAKIRTEQAILLPQSTESYRPDRVVERDGAIEIIDYKFGNQQKQSYIRQLNHYIELLKQMGYSNVNGYIWYVELDEIIKV